jgi:hypothetical protein
VGEIYSQEREKTMRLYSTEMSQVLVRAQDLLNGRQQSKDALLRSERSLPEAMAKLVASEKELADIEAECALNGSELPKRARQQLADRRADVDGLRAGSVG